MKHAVLGCSVVSCKSGPPRLFCNRCETSHLMEKDLWFLLGEIFFSLLLLLFVDVFVYLSSLRTYSCTASALPKIGEHTTMCSMLWTARPPPPLFFKQGMLILKSTIREGHGTSWLCPRPVGGQGAFLPSSSYPRTQAKLWPYLMIGRNKFWFCIVPRWLPQATNFATGISSRTMQYLGSI